MKKNNLYLLLIVITILSCSQKDCYGDCYSDNADRILDGSPTCPFLSTGSPTDLAIDGQGFFILNNRSDETVLFTRIGAFDFDEDGYLVSDQGYIVRGWRALNDPATGEPVIVGSIHDIQIVFLPSSDDDAVRNGTISVDETGFIYGQNASGETIPLYRITLARFTDSQALEETDDKYYTWTPESEEPITSAPGENGYGTIESNALETPAPSSDNNDGSSCFISTILKQQARLDVR